MKKKIFTIFIAAILTATALCFSGCGEKEKKYILYFGLNDADTGAQILNIDDASDKIRSIITGKGFGFTEYRAYGAYTEDGKINGNDTLIYLLFFVKKEDMTAIVAEAKRELNLASVLVEESASEYYFG